MQKNEWRRSMRGWRGAALLAVALLLLVTGLWFPGSVRGPDSVAREFLETLIRTPGDTARLRTAGQLRESDDPRALIDALPVQVALEYLHARSIQQIGHEIRIADRPKTQAPDYAVVLRVDERHDGERAPARRFHVDLRQDDSGTWRVTALSVVP